MWFIKFEIDPKGRVSFLLLDHSYNFSSYLNFKNFFLAFLGYCRCFNKDDWKESAINEKIFNHYILVYCLWNSEWWYSCLGFEKRIITFRAQVSIFLKEFVEYLRKKGLFLNNYLVFLVNNYLQKCGSMPFFIFYMEYE